jgi:hypothetical protein
VAIGTYNFSGDLGKVTLAVLAAVILATLPLARLLRPAVEGNPFNIS